MNYSMELELRLAIKNSLEKFIWEERISVL